MANIIGYSYYLAIHMGLARGPIDSVVEIRVGDKLAWPTGVTTPITTNSQIPIALKNLFGGEKREGGLVGTLDFMFGGPAQVAPAWLKSSLSGLVPDFRGVTSLAWTGMVSQMSPYPKPWAVRMRRALNGWDGDVWHPELALIVLTDESKEIHAMNPAHILYECATNRVWGRGLDRTLMDETSFLAAATTLSAEGLGLCLRWNRQDQLDNFVQHVVDHIGGSIYLDRETGKIALKLIRGDYDLEDVLQFDYSTGLLSIEQAETGGGHETVNEVIVKYRSPLKNEERQIRIHNLASIHSLGGSINSVTKEYPGFATGALALRAAQRDLKVVTAGKHRFRLTLDRRAWRIYPGVVFGITAPDKGISNLILRAGKVTLNPLNEDDIQVEAVVDVFGMPSVSFIDVQPPNWEPPDASALDVTNRFVREATYYEMYRASLATGAADTDGRVIAMAARPNDLAFNFEMHGSPEGLSTYTLRDAGAWSPYGALTGALTPYSTAISLASGHDLEDAVAGTLAQIGGELVEIVTVTADVTGTTATATIKRGTVDTVPVAHSVGAKVFFLGNTTGNAFDPTEFVAGDSVDVKLVTVTTEGPGGLVAATADNIDIIARQARPYPPGNVTVNGTPALETPTISGDDLTFAWTHRDRVVQKAQIRDHSETSVGPEAGTTYSLRLYDNASLLRTISGISGASQVYTDAMSIDDGHITPLRVELEAVRSGLTSFGVYNFTIGRTGFGYDPDALTFFAVMTTQPSKARKKLYNEWVEARKAGNCWTQLRGKWLLSAHDSQASLVNLRNPAQIGQIISTPTFTADQGWDFNGSSHALQMNVPMSGGTFLRDNAHMTATPLENIAQSGAPVCGPNSAATPAAIYPRSATDGATFNANMATGVTITGVTDSRGQFGWVRTASNAGAAFRNGAVLGTPFTNVSTADPTTTSFCIGKYGSVFGNTRMMGEAGFGGAMTDAEMLAGYNADRTFMQAVGAPLP